ncbi:MAG: hypothetical protein A2X79_02025 [Desulfuromonadaceae bacterium GWB2_53_15]|nr:MAG: hypothetical protein A2X83_07710 [Desulfuromonadales bacterium GWD2_54_10]OHB32754.1 MAG: hypothetical protein A2X79_02025 [Desulfuromonadaceae bacterium GWB2_53_15]
MKIIRMVHCGFMAAVVLAVFAVPQGLCAAGSSDVVERDRVLPLKPTSDWNSQMALGILPAADLEGRAASVGISDYRFRLVKNHKLDSKMTLTIGGGYGLKHIDASTSVGLPQDLHALFLEAGAHYGINDKSFVTLKVYPGLYSDFSDIGSDDLRLPVLALGGYAFDSGITLVGGFAYRFGNHDSTIIPAIGITYQLDERWRLSIIAPRPAVIYNASREMSFFVGGDFASDEYELKDRSLGAKVIKYRDYKVMGGVEYLPQPAVKLTGAIGYAFDRRFDFYDGNRSGMGIDNVPFFRLALDMGW